MSDTKNGRDELTKAVSSLARAIDTICRTIDRYAHELEKTDVPRTFDHAQNLLSASRTRAELSFEVARSANGGFSLDKEPEPIALPVTRPVARDAPRPAPVIVERERIAGERRGATPPVEDGVEWVDN